MRKIQTSIMVAGGLLCVLLLMMCAKTDRAKGLEDVTVSNSIINNLPDANKWFEFTFQAPDAGGLNEDQIAPRKLRVQEYYVAYLGTVQHGVSHDIYFRWIKLTENPLTYKLQSYLTPAATHLGNPAGKESSAQGASDPPPPKPPPPPPL